MPEQKKVWLRTLLTALAAFCVYTCMYAYRKPFTIAQFEGHPFLGIDYKVWLVIAQTTGYTFSKFFGIHFISELKHHRRGMQILLLILMGWGALLFFAFIPPPYNILCLLINGFPLGVIYGIVFSYLEGRRTTEFLGAVLTTSFIFASGFTQSAGKFIMLRGNVNQWWMPFITGLLFLLPLLFSLWLLEKTLPPDAKDVAERTERKPMDSLGRKRFLRTFLPGLVLLIMSYIILTVLRDYRSNFAADMWSELGRKEDASLFTKTEIPASITVLGMMSLLILVKQNLRALIVNHVIIVAGFILTLCATVLFDYQQLSPFWWFTLTGIGLYMSYVPFNAMLFDRLIASFRYVSNAGFIIYVADAFGYLGSDAILVVKIFLHSSLEWTAFFIDLIFYGSIAGITMVIFSAIYFYKKHEHYFFEYHKIKYV